MVECGIVLVRDAPTQTSHVRKLLRISDPSCGFWRGVEASQAEALPLAAV